MHRSQVLEPGDTASAADGLEGALPERAAVLCHKPKRQPGD